LVIQVFLSCFHNTFVVICVVNLNKLITGIVLIMVGTLVTFVLFDALFGPTNTAVSSLNDTLNTAGYSNEASIAVTAWQLILLGVPLAIVAIGVAFIVGAFKGGLGK
jgi:hypothetical protein